MFITGLAALVTRTVLPIKANDLGVSRCRVTGACGGKDAAGAPER
jgi:hypothetical protein